MSELLDRTFEEPSVDQRERSGGTGPPKEMPEIERSIRPRWPRSAKIVVAVVGVLALAGMFGTAVQYLGDGTDDEVAQLTEERDDLVAEHAALVDDVAALESDRAELAADLDAMTAQLATVTAHSEALTDRVGDQQATIDSLTVERDALASMFPMIVDASLVGVDVAGDYSVAWLPVYNEGLAGVGLPIANQVSIRQTAEGWLEVTIPGFITADLHRTDGALFTMVDTTSVVPPADGLARLARVAITIYAGETVTAVDGTTQVTDLGMSVGISTPATATAPAGVALYGAELTPNS